MRAGRKVGERSPRTGWRGVHRFALRVSAAGALATVPLLATAVPAYAVTSVSAAENVLNIESGSASDDLTISVDSSGRFTVTNTADTLVPGVGCRTVTAHKVRCSGTGITGIAIITAGGDDAVRNDTALTTAATLGPGDDTYIGGSARDVVVGGAGDDTIEGRGGPDVIIGGEGTDQADGGAGSDLCLADIETGCEI
ncbi:calcium-binding protein [Thermopolyspora sp. NPDC052614]|uniref:calcium-binding protein n=1 Tax=Thermopolyspora sp. NPDC052614 TaxID=3155682 RepID=UPI003444C0D5